MYALSSRHDRMFIGSPEYCGLLSLAQMFGWRPAGTNAPVDFDQLDERDESGNLIKAGAEECDGNYTEDLFQEVTEEDAKKLVEALERAIGFLQWLRAANPNEFRAVICNDAQWNAVLGFSSLSYIEIMREFISVVEGGFLIGW
jgi:hypothetical protein